MKSDVVVLLEPNTTKANEFSTQQGLPRPIHVWPTHEPLAAMRAMCRQTPRLRSVLVLRSSDQIQNAHALVSVANWMLTHLEDWDVIYLNGCALSSVSTVDQHVVRVSGHYWSMGAAVYSRRVIDAALQGTRDLNSRRWRRFASSVFYPTHEPRALSLMRWCWPNVIGLPYARSYAFKPFVDDVNRIMRDYKYIRVIIPWTVSVLVWTVIVLLLFVGWVRN